MSIPKNPSTTLDALPSEIRRIIVSHLAPSAEALARGSKAHLKNANLAHSCLREWVPEFMFRDMALEHIIVGMTSHLERFAVDRNNNKLLKHVKSIQVKVSPAIRWEVDAAEDFNTITDNTISRLCNKFDVREQEELTEDQRNYCLRYHRALVKPFVDNRGWYELQRDAKASWGEVFAYFPHLQHIGVSCCERIDQPLGTYTNLFITQYGKEVLSEADPPYVEDSAVNVAWASALVLQSAPSNVRSLHLSMANVDNFNSFATVNRLLSIVYRTSEFPNLNPPLEITRLCLTLRGVDGLHGELDGTIDCASAGSLRYWKKVLSSLSNLTHLEFRQDTHRELTAFTDGEDTDFDDNLIAHLLQDYESDKLQTLRLCGLWLNENMAQRMFSTHWPSLSTIFLDDISALAIPREDEDEEEGYQEKYGAHSTPRLGEGWLRICQSLLSQYPSVDICIKRPMDHHGIPIHPHFVAQLSELAHVKLDVSGYQGWGRSLEELLGSIKVPTDIKTPINGPAHLSALE